MPTLTAQWRDACRAVIALAAIYGPGHPTVHAAVRHRNRLARRLVTES